jgi:hypothetical protein
VQVGLAGDCLDRSRDAGGLGEGAVDFCQPLLDAGHRIDQRRHTLNGVANGVTLILQVGAGRFGCPVRGGGVDLPVGIQQHVGAAAQPPELRILTLDSLGETSLTLHAASQTSRPTAPSLRPSEATSTVAPSTAGGTGGSEWLWRKLAVRPDHHGATVAAIGTGDTFGKGRDFAAWLGLVAKQISTGDRTILGNISKRGNRCLRVLFVQAAWVVLIKPKSWERHGLKQWIEAARKRLHRNVLAIALANKLARIAWSVLAHGRNFEARNIEDAAARSA